MTARNNYLLRTYGITDADYRRILRQQGGCCAVCKRPASSFKSRMCVDHDHKTRSIRGILCVFCNRRVIGRHRDPDLLQAAADYLRQNTGYFVPEKKKKRKRKKK